MMTMGALRTNPPDTCTVWNKTENVAATADHRLMTPTLTPTAGIGCLFIPLSANEKATLGFMAVQDIRRIYIADMTYSNTGTTGDILTLASDTDHAYQITEWITYGEPALAYYQHVEALCERMPTIPEGCLP